MSKSKKCSTPSCTDEAECAGLCKPCYSGVYYWMKKGVAAAMHRASRLRVFQERMDAIRPANVSHIRQRKRA